METTCAYCKKPIVPRTPAVEVAVGFVDDGPDVGFVDFVIEDNEHCVYLHKLCFVACLQAGPVGK